MLKKHTDKLMTVDHFVNCSLLFINTWLMWLLMSVVLQCVSRRTLAALQPQILLTWKISDITYRECSNSPLRFCLVRYDFIPLFGHQLINTLIILFLIVIQIILILYVLCSLYLKFVCLFPLSCLVYTCILPPIQESQSMMRQMVWMTCSGVECSILRV